MSAMTSAGSTPARRLFVPMRMSKYGGRKGATSLSNRSTAVRLVSPLKDRLTVGNAR